MFSRHCSNYTESLSNFYIELIVNELQPGTSIIFLKYAMQLIVKSVLLSLLVKLEKVGADTQFYEESLLMK